MTARKVDVFAYNYRSLEHVSLYELQADKDMRDRVIRATNPSAHMQALRIAVG